MVTVFFCRTHHISSPELRGGVRPAAPRPPHTHTVAVSSISKAGQPAASPPGGEGGDSGQDPPWIVFTTGFRRRPCPFPRRRNFLFSFYCLMLRFFKWVCLVSIAVGICLYAGHLSCLISPVGNGFKWGQSSAFWPPGLGMQRGLDIPSSPPRPPGSRGRRSLGHLPPLWSEKEALSQAFCV